VILFYAESKKSGMDEACRTDVGEERCVQGFGGGKVDGKRPLGRPKCRWEDKIKMDIQEFGWVHGLD